MTDMLRTASGWLRDQRKQFLSEQVQYLPLTGSTFSAPASRGTSIFRSENEYGISVVVHAIDFIFDAADVSVTPQKGDEIIADSRKYEVLAPNDEPVWRWSGASGESIRIHVKDMGAVNV